VRRVNLVGIGPGSPALLTLKAAETIRGADVVRHPPGVDSDHCGDDRRS